MPLVIGQDEALKKPLRRSDQLAYFKFPDQLELPHATLNGHEPGGYFLETHYHERDQFQVAIDGSFTIGRHLLTPYSVHFTRAYTPYGPLVSQGQAFSFMVLRAHRDPGARRMPKSRELLRQVVDRRPWQISQPVSFPPPEARPASTDVLLNQVPNIQDDQGLAVYTLVVKPNAKAIAPDPTRTDGQYLIVVKGSFWHDDKEHKAIGLVFVTPQEGPYEIHAGAEGLEALVLNYPEVKPRAADGWQPPAAVGFKKWHCVLCGFDYDEALGLPSEGLPAGTRWKDVPDTWQCPDCSATKSDFQMVEV